MHVMQESCEIGLRERKRAATQRAIEEAAVEIAFTQGYQAATAEAIAAQAGVSLRTFFNYFANKDTAIAGEGRRATDTERGVNLLVENEPHLLKGIARIFEWAAFKDPSTPEMRGRRRELYKKYPPLLHHHFTSIDVFETDLAAIVAAYFEQRPAQRRLADKLTAEEEARLAVTMFGSAMRYSVLSLKARVIDTNTRVRDIERSIDLMAEFREGDR